MSKKHNFICKVVPFAVAALLALPAVSATWVITLPQGELRFDDWGYSGPGGRGALDFAPLNGGFGGPAEGNNLDPSGGVGQIQRVITRNPDWLTQDGPADVLGDLANYPLFSNANMDGTVNFYEWAYTTEAGSTFSNMRIDYDGDYLIKRHDMQFSRYRVFMYRDVTGANPNEDYDSLIDFQPYALSDAIGWCGSVLATHPLALEPMAGQVMFDVTFDTFLPASPNVGVMQIIPDFMMRSYGTMEVHGGAGNKLFTASAIVNNTDPALGRDLNNPLGMADPEYHNRVSFMGGSIVPGGIWLYSGFTGPLDVVIHDVQGAPGTVGGEVRASDGAVWHTNTFAGYPFMLRADGDRIVEFFDESVYGPVPTNPPAGPMPAGSLIGIDQGVGSGENIACTTGSCFGMEVAPAFVIWTNIGPGSDGGIIVGKDQAEGEITAPWSFFSNLGSFITTAPPTDSSANIFSTTSCTGANCIGVTELGTWTALWNEIRVPLGGANGCTSVSCTPDQQAGILVNNWSVNPDNTYSMDYSNVVPNGDPSGFGNVSFSLKLSGGFSMVTPKPTPSPTPVPTPIPPTLPPTPTPTPAPTSTPSCATQISNGDIIVEGRAGVSVPWIPDVLASSMSTCLISTAPTSGTAAVAEDCSSGSFIATSAGVYAFYYDSEVRPDSSCAVLGDTGPGKVTVTINEANSCKELYPQISVTMMGNGGQGQTEEETMTTTFQGHIITTDNNKGKITICRGTTVSYEVFSTVGTARCTVKHGVSTESIGTLTDKGKLVCSNKPDGKDTDKFKIKRSKRKITEPNRQSKKWYR